MKPLNRAILAALTVVFAALANFPAALAQDRPAAATVAPALAQEVIEPGEQDLIDSITAVSLDRLKKQFPPGVRPVKRDAHPKAHGLVSAEFIVLDGLPEQLRYGVFRAPRTFDALIRFSAGNVEVQADTVPQAAGMAIKLLGVEGDKLLEAEKDAKTQDFIMINFRPSSSET